MSTFTLLATFGYEAAFGGPGSVPLEPSRLFTTNISDTFFFTGDYVWAMNFRTLKLLQKLHKGK